MQVAALLLCLLLTACAVGESADALYGEDTPKSVDRLSCDEPAVSYPPLSKNTVSVLRSARMPVTSDTPFLKPCHIPIIRKRMPHAMQNFAAAGGPKRLWWWTSQLLYMPERSSASKRRMPCV